MQCCNKNIARGTTYPGYWVHNSNHPPWQIIWSAAVTFSFNALFYLKYRKWGTPKTEKGPLGILVPNWVPMCAQCKPPSLLQAGSCKKRIYHEFKEEYISIRQSYCCKELREELPPGEVWSWGRGPVGQAGQGGNLGPSGRQNRYINHINHSHPTLLKSTL